MHKFWVSIGVMTTFIAFTGYLFLDVHCDSCNDFFEAHANGFKADIIGSSKSIEDSDIQKKTQEELDAIKKAEIYKNSYLESQKRAEIQQQQNELYWEQRYEEGKEIVAEYESERQEKLEAEK